MDERVASPDSVPIDLKSDAAFRRNQPMWSHNGYHGRNAIYTAKEYMNLTTQILNGNALHNLQF